MIKNPKFDQDLREYMDDLGRVELLSDHRQRQVGSILTRARNIIRDALYKSPTIGVYWGSKAKVAIESREKQDRYVEVQNLLDCAKRLLSYSTRARDTQSEAEYGTLKDTIKKIMGGLPLKNSVILYELYPFQQARDNKGDNLIDKEEQRITDHTNSFYSIYTAYRNELIIHTQRLVIKKASRYKNRGISVIDLIGYGNIGLAKAIDEWDPTRAPLVAFAGEYIKNEMLRQLPHAPIVEIPNDRYWMSLPLLREKERGKLETGKEPSPEGLAKATDIPLHTVKELLVWQRRLVELDANVDDKTNIGNLVLSDDGPIDQHFSAIELADTLKLIPAEDQEVLNRLCGMNGYPQETLEQMAESMGLGYNQIRWLTRRSRQRFRDAMPLAALAYKHQ